MKMSVYLLCQLIELLEANAQQADSAAIAVGGKAKRNKKLRLDDEDDSAWDWESRRQEAVTLLFRLVSLNLNALFDPPIVEEEFVNLLGNCMFRLLENPLIAQQKFRDVRTSILQVLGTMNSKYNYSLSCRLKIVQALKHFEHLVVRSFGYPDTTVFGDGNTSPCHFRRHSAKPWSCSPSSLAARTWSWKR